MYKNPYLNSLFNKTTLFNITTTENNAGNDETFALTYYVNI